MPVYDYHCNKCNKEYELVSSVAERNNVNCPDCNTKLDKLVSSLRNSLDPFKPYILENGVEHPVLIESREQRDKIFKENKIEQKTYPNRKYHPYSRIFPVSGSCSKGSGTKWTGTHGLDY